MSTIVLGISSGIAAFKALDLIKKLRTDRNEVIVIMTKSATSMIDEKDVEKASGNTVYTSLFPLDFNPEKILKDRVVDHIEIAKKADIVVIVPTTANTVGKIANGLADDFLTTTLLATLAPILICPSMNTNMWNNPLVQENIEKLEKLGYVILSPDSGSLACGTEGIGRLPEIEIIHNEIKTILMNKHRLSGKKIIVTAGGTQEAIDDVRMITNKSSGKMGRAIAEACYRQGAEVLLLRSTSSVKTNLPIKEELFQTAEDLEHLIYKYVPQYDVIFHVAAVADFSSKKITGKIESTTSLDIHLKPTHKIINKIKTWNPKIFLIGFKAVTNIPETEMKTKADLKLVESNADFVMVNDVAKKGIGFNAEDNEVYVFPKNGGMTKLPRNSKKEIAEKIIALTL